MAEKMILEIPVHPEKRDELIAIMKGALPDTRAYDGNLGIEMWTPEDDSGTLMIFEVWETREHQGRYLQWRTETGLVEVLGPFLSGALKIRWLTEHPYE